MCAIIDTSVLGDIVGKTRTEAGTAFLNGIIDGRGKIFYGGTRQLVEYSKVTGFPDLVQELERQGLAQELSKGEVDDLSARLVKDHVLRAKAKDSHILAIALLSGARLLYANDKNLHEDFKNTSIIYPKGKVYSTNDINFPNDNKMFTEEKEALLRNNPCRRRN